MTERRLRGPQFSITFSITVITENTFQEYGNKDSLRNILKRQSAMNESSGSQFFGNTTRVYSGPHTTEE